MISFNDVTQQHDFSGDIDQDSQEQYLQSDSLDAALDNRVAEASRIIAEKGLNAIDSKVIRDNRRHITRADYGDIRPLLGSENVAFPRVKSLQGRALRRAFPAGLTISHREFDNISHSYRLGVFVDEARKKGWTLVNHDDTAITADIVPRIAKFTRYELFAEFTPELRQRIVAFCKAVDDFESKATAKHGNAKAA